MSAVLLALPDRDLTDLPRALRALAVAVGLAGAAPETVATAHLLFAIAQRKLEKA